MTPERKSTQQRQVDEALMLLGLKPYPLSEQELQDQKDEDEMLQSFAWFVLGVVTAVTVFAALMGWIQ